MRFVSLCMTQRKLDRKQVERLFHQVFQCWDSDDTTTQMDHPFLVHVVQFAGNIQSTFCDEACQCLHLNLEDFLSCRPHTMCFYEPDDFVADASGGCPPWLVGDTLTLCTDDTQQIQLENHLFLSKAQGVGFVDTDQLAHGDCGE